MEECTKLGVLDYDESPSDEYKNDLYNPPSSQDSGYGSSLNNSDTSMEPAGGISPQSVEQEAYEYEQDIGQPPDMELRRTQPEIDYIPSEQQDDVINGSSHCTRGNPEFRDHPDLPMATCPLENKSTATVNIIRWDSSDIVEERQHSLEEVGMANTSMLLNQWCRDIPDSSQPRCPIRELTSQQQDLDKPLMQNDTGKNHAKSTLCCCNRQPTKQTSIMHNNDTTIRCCVSTSPDGHYIAECSDVFQETFSLQPGDKLISIDTEDVFFQGHDVIITKMHEFTHMDRNTTPRTKELELVIERHTHSEDDTCIHLTRILILLGILDEDGFASSLQITIQKLLNWGRTFHVIMNLQLKGVDKCWIGLHCNNHDGLQYLCADNADTDKLTLRYQNHSDDPKFQFCWSQFKGFQEIEGRYYEVYICMIMSKETYGCISVGSLSDVKLKVCDDDPNEIHHVTSPLPHMFIYRTDGAAVDNAYTLESLYHKDCFLRWNTSKQRLDIKKMDDTNGHIAPPEMQFHMFTA